MKFRASMTWGEHGWLWFREPGYLSIGIGPLYLQFEWADEGRV